MANFAKDFKELNIIVSFFQPRVSLQNFEPYKLPKTQSTPYDISDPFFHSLKEPSNSHFLLDSQKNTVIQKINEENTNRLYKTLDNLHEECKEEGYEEFAPIAQINAKKILDFLCKHFPEYDYDIYPTDEREVNIEFYSFKGRILILCDSEGSVAYFKHLNGKTSRHRCQDIIDFPFDQLYKEFEFFRDPTKKNVLYDNNSNIKSLEILSNEYRCA